MKNITLSADEDLIERARSVARARRTTLNAAFREWLAQFTATSGDAHGYDALMKRLAMAGDKTAAKKAYDVFFEEWKNADAGLPVLAEAKKEYASLI